ncbi:MAG: Maf family protein [Fuerstiella sp.]
MQIILGSQSPRRRELLASVAGADRLIVRPPIQSDEAGFAGLVSVAGIEQRLSEVVRSKHEDVTRQIRHSEFGNRPPCIICADTIVVATSSDNNCIVLEKPPAETWQPTVKDWFVRYYSDRPHDVWTCCRISGDDQVREFIVKTTVRLCKLDDWLIDWYLSTGEPVGKAGGYGLQGDAAMLVESVDGSLTNVIGLPMLEVTSVLREFGALNTETL